MSKVKMISVEGSSTIIGHQHTAGMNTMLVQYRGADSPVYRYEGVSASLYQQLISAPSIGSAISKQFRGKTQAHPCTKISQSNL